jgi:hypothetical protein
MPPSRNAAPADASRPVAAILLALRWIVAFAATCVLAGCVAVAGVFVFRIADIDQDADVAVIVVSVSLAVGAGCGALVYLVARAFAKVMFAALALVLVTGGMAMLVAAPVVRQMNTPDLAEYRGSDALYLFGFVTVTLGLALAVLCVHWSLQPAARQVLSRWARLLGSAYGIMLALSGISAIFLMLTLINGEAEVAEDGTVTSVVEQAIAFTAIAMWSLVPGLILTYHGISASMGERSGEFRPPIGAVVAAVFAGVLAIGGWNMARVSPAALPMPPLHVLAAALPGIALIGMAGRGSALRGVRVRGVTWRQLTLAAALSMSLATVIAIYVESIGAIYAIVLLLVHNGAFELADNADDVFEIIGDSSFILTNNEQFVANLITAAVLAPISEEFAKSLGVRFMMRGNSTRAQVFMIGAAAGAGFGFLEAMLYGLGVITEGLDNWWWIMLVRGGSTSLHVICTGLAGLAWWYWSIAKRHGVAAALFGAAIAIHALWNGFFTMLDSRIFGLETLNERTLEVVAYVVVAAVSGAMVASVPLVARRLRTYEPPPVEGSELSRMWPMVAL